jgi:hypothetical protein
MTGGTLKENNKAARKCLRPAVNQSTIRGMNSHQVRHSTVEKREAALAAACPRDAAFSALSVAVAFALAHGISLGAGLVLFDLFAQMHGLFVPTVIVISAATLAATLFSLKTGAFIVIFAAATMALLLPAADTVPDAAAAAAYSMIASLAATGLIYAYKQAYNSMRKKLRIDAAYDDAVNEPANDDFITVSMTAAACALSSRACAAQSRTRARTPDAGRILSSVRDLFARTVAHLRDATSTLRAAGSGLNRAA